MQQSEQIGASYGRFMAMIGTSTVVMFVLMYLNTYVVDHVFWSETRFWMAFVMGAAMAAVMLLFMWSMYRSRAKNWAIVSVAVTVFAGALFLVRSQVSVTDREYMSAMIPHHSIAVLTSERAQIEDARVRELANGIIRSQRKEIEEMNWLIDDIGANGVAATIEAAKARPVPEFEVNLNEGNWHPDLTRK